MAQILFSIQSHQQGVAVAAQTMLEETVALVAAAVILVLQVEQATRLVPALHRVMTAVRGKGLLRHSAPAAAAVQVR
jgi:hypothetical protein